MLHSWVSTSNNRKDTLPYSFSGRGDLWSVQTVGDSGPMAAGREIASIASGLIAGTMVATELGWQRVEDLRSGDRVVTFDNGMRPLKTVQISTLWTAESAAPRGLWPLEVPAKALGNREAIRLLPDQAVLIESDEAEALYGDPFMMVKANVLEGYNAITRVPPMREMKIVTLVFEGDEVVYASGTTLVHCPNEQGEMVHSAEEMMLTGGKVHYQQLTDRQARRLIDAMHGADLADLLDLSDLSDLGALSTI
ncbi:Hint domain-containing protein [Pararhodobacter oceanensis]|uniref:Hedgehog/Intein (Hint) domain-containing protein n=1 Tax=Pararhodobacter oceanensis TaxID=2172121 RepID=A0A2T8HUD1_9RHOB|nr:Hint domain-containing protein [Pararhodobacter oceanensis]PVH29059.1 hypothetical protein DDE20_08510 [Pararhodobacter oceanensis]